MLDLRDPKRVVVEGERGYYFNSMPSKRTLKEMSGLELKFNLILIGIIVAVVTFFMLIPMFLEGGILSILLMLLLLVFTLEFVMLIVAIMLRIDRWKEKRNKAKGIKKEEPKLYDYVKVFRSVMILHFYMIFYDRTNIVPMKDVKAVHFDVPEFLQRKGIKLPSLYKPFRQKSPNALKYEGALYSNFPPLDHLVRIEMKRPVKIKGWNPKLKSIKSLSDPFAADTIRSVDNLIISIRPADQKKFKEVMDATISSQ